MVSRKTLLSISVSLLIVPAPVLAQAQPGQSEVPQSNQTTTAAPGSAGTTPSTTSPQGPNQVGQSEASRAPAQQDGLQDIVITAQQRGENLQKAAIAVAVVSGADLLNSGTRGVETLSRLVPSLEVAGSGQGNLIFIRGVGNFSFTANSDPAAAYNFDGVYVGRSSSTFGTFYDLERVEVLKGPQGTLYGRNATAGAINILPVQPRLGETSGYASLGYGNYNAIDGEAGVNVGLGENAGFRLSGTYTRHDPYLRSGTQTDDSFGVRGQIKAKLTPDLTVRIEADYAQQRGVGSGATYVASLGVDPTTGALVSTPSGLPLDEGLYTAAAQAYRTSHGIAGSLNRFLDPLTLLPFVHNDVYGAALHVDWQTPIGTVSIIPAWRQGLKQNLSFDAGQYVGDTLKSDQYSVEARLVSNSGRLFDYILGAYYYSEIVDDDTHLSGGVQAAFTKARYKTHSPAAYGRLTLHATDWLRFTGGLRYTEDHKTFGGTSDTLIEVCVLPTRCPTAPLLPYTTTLSQQPLVPVAGGPPGVLGPGLLLIHLGGVNAGKLDTSKVTYRGAVEIDVAPRSLLYASVETGYRAGGFNNSFNFDPENITAYTVGLKNRLLDNRLQLNLEAFHWKYRGEQLSFLGVDPKGQIGILTENVGRSTIQGGEVEARALVTPTTTLSANIQYLDAKFDSFSYATPAPPVTGCRVAGTTTFTVDCSGEPALNAPKWTMNFGAEQIVPVGDRYQVVLSADTQYRTHRYVGSEYIPSVYVGGAWASNAQVSVGAKDGAFVLSAYVRNIEGHRTPIFGAVVPASNLAVSLPGLPRTYGLRISGRF